MIRRPAFVGRGLGLALIAAYSGVQAAAGLQPGLHLVSSPTPVRGIYRFTTTSWSALAGDGFNWVTDGGATTNNYAGQKAAGLTGMVYLNAYDNSSCAQTMTDATITQVVKTNVSAGNVGAVYQVGDEPTANGCNANPTYSHMTAVIHAADLSAKSWVADDQFNDPSTSHWPAGLPMKGSVDILAFDIYPCQAGPCRFDMIDLAIQRIHSEGVKNWEFILQDFGPCQSWRAPNAPEVMQQFQHWQGAGALGYWVYTYDSDSTPCPGNVAGSAVLHQINSMAVNPASPTKPPSPVAKASPAASPTSSASSRPTGIAQITASPTPSLGSRPTSPAIVGLWPLPLTLIGIGLLMALVAVGLNYFRRRSR